jgi:hypothetical protein
VTGSLVRRSAALFCGLVALLIAPGASPAFALAQDPSYRTETATTERIEVGSTADSGFRELWQASTTAGAELVACIGGERRDGVARITQVLQLSSGRADSLAASASGSIEQCGPPDWFGTAHTHIARYDGQHPYPAFSGADRGVMMLWWKRWQADGVFCVLYSATQAHCETSGASPGLVAGPGTQTSY